jgi:hypothetical protein
VAFSSAQLGLDPARVRLNAGAALRFVGAIDPPSLDLGPAWPADRSTYFMPWKSVECGIGHPIQHVLDGLAVE